MIAAGVPRPEVIAGLRGDQPSLPPAPAAPAPPQGSPAPPPPPPVAPAPSVKFANFDELLENIEHNFAPKRAPVAATAPAKSAKPTAAEALAGPLTCKLELTQRERLTLATLTPPQTSAFATPAKATCGAHCLVLDVSFSMEAAATVTSSDGDKVDHGFSVLDIAKHAMCTYVSSLGDDDFCSVACYASEARMVIGWTAATADGKEALFTAIKALKEEGSTNLTAGITTGMLAFEALPDKVAANPSEYALLLAVATDGQPSSGTHPPGGASYRDFVTEKAGGVAAKYGHAAVPQVVAIGLGNDLDSTLLHSFSDTFLHIPDPGSVGPFMVNLLAATQCTARVAIGAAADGAAPAACTASRAVLRLSPASSVAAVPGFAAAAVVGDEVLVDIGLVMYDQPRHVLVASKPGAPPLSATVTVEDAVIASCAAPAPATAGDATFDAEVGRTAAVCALQLQQQQLALSTPKDEVAARLQREGARIGDVTISLIWNDQSDLDLHVKVPTPGGEEAISYSHKKSKCGGVELDVDMNAGAPYSKEPVENVYAGDVERGMQAPLGTYKVQVCNFGFHGEGVDAAGAATSAEPREIKYQVQVRMNGDEVTDYTGTMTKAKETHDVCEFTYAGRTETGQTEKLQAATRARKAEAARLSAVPKDLLEQATALLGEGALKTTLTNEALLAVKPEYFKTWGRHYLVTLPQMLQVERRSNFRDAALQAFGHDASRAEAFFESLSTDAEMCFASLEPPKPSGLERVERQRKAAETRAAQAATAAERAAIERAHRPAYTPGAAMPDEFMRGGGCFAPEALVACVDPSDGTERALPIAAVRAGMLVRTPSGGTAAVRCVVESACAGGVAVFSELRGGLQLTEWHPVRDGAGRWRFPTLLGRRVLRPCASVFNLVLSREHVALVGGVACCTLAHGIEGPVIGHAFWGTAAVLEQLRTSHADGWAAGRVVLEAPLRAPAASAHAVAMGA